MEEIKVGEYVRSDYGEIFKVIKKEWYEREELWFYNKKHLGGCWSDQVVKHSPNIIDLIEERRFIKNK